MSLRLSAFLRTIKSKDRLGKEKLERVRIGCLWDGRWAKGRERGRGDEVELIGRTLCSDGGGVDRLLPLITLNLRKSMEDTCVGLRGVVSMMMSGEWRKGEDG